MKQKLKHDTIAFKNQTYLCIDAARYVKEEVTSICVTRLYQKCKNNGIESQYRSNEQDRRFSKRNYTSYRNLNLWVGQEKLEEFIHVYDENNEVFTSEILDDVEEVL